jgi:hypothetical protein
MGKETITLRCADDAQVGSIFFDTCINTEQLNFTRQCVMELNHRIHADSASCRKSSRVEKCFSLNFICKHCSVVEFSGSLDDASINKFWAIKSENIASSWWTLMDDTCRARKGKKQTRHQTIYPSIIKFNLMAFCDFCEWEMLHVRWLESRGTRNGWI